MDTWYKRVMMKLSSKTLGFVNILFAIIFSSWVFFCVPFPSDTGFDPISGMPSHVPHTNRGPDL